MANIFARSTLDGDDMRQQLEKDGSQVFEIGSRTSSLASVCEGIVALWGPRCEAILHDFSDLEHSVVHVSGNITGRAIGAPLTDLGLQVLTSASHDQDVLVYHAKAPNGALLKSVSILIRERPRGRIMGALCINSRDRASTAGARDNRRTRVGSH